MPSTAMRPVGARRLRSWLARWENRARRRRRPWVNCGREALLGFGFAMLSSWMLARTVLRGEASTFSLELPPYRPPDFWKTLYTSVIDRTLIVLWRAVVFALPAGAAIWLSANVFIGDHSIAAWFVQGTDPFARLIGLTGVILLAYIVAIPANEIVVPTILILTVLVTGAAGGQGAGVMFETDPAMCVRSSKPTVGHRSLPCASCCSASATTRARPRFTPSTRRRAVGNGRRFPH